MQTLKRRPVKPNTPTSASQARGSVACALNRDENLSAAGSKTRLNNPEVNTRLQVGGLKVLVPVFSFDGEQIMPCKAVKARHLLRDGMAIVVGYNPFSIQLLFECENNTQAVYLGIDTGYVHVGISAVTEKREVFSAEVLLDGKTSERKTTQSMYRRNRRNKLRYRKPKFLNRKKKKGWLPPSTQRKVDTHVNIFLHLAKYIPISEVHVEAGNFDIQKIINPEISVTVYQEVDLYVKENLKSFLLQRENGKCQLCGEGCKKNDHWHMHHVTPRAEGGTDRAENRALLHESCHKDLHAGKLFDTLRPAKEFKAEAFMNIARPFIIAGLKKHFTVEETFGYITKINRIENGIEKSHENDAFVIAGGTTQKRSKTYLITQKHRNNRSLGMQRKGYAPSSRKQRYPIQPKDLVWVNGEKITAKGTQNLGKVIMLQDKKTVGIKKIEKTFHFGSLVYGFKNYEA